MVPITRRASFPYILSSSSSSLSCPFSLSLLFLSLSLSLLLSLGSSCCSIFYLSLSFVLACLPFGHWFRPLFWPVLLVSLIQYATTFYDSLALSCYEINLHMHACWACACMDQWRSKVDDVRTYAHLGLVLLLDIDMSTISVSHR